MCFSWSIVQDGQWAHMNKNRQSEITVKPYTFIFLPLRHPYTCNVLNLYRSDNDQYSHINNAVYYHFFDSIVSAYLIEKCGLDPRASPLIGLVVSSYCQVSSFAPSSYPCWKRPMAFGWMECWRNHKIVFRPSLFSASPWPRSTRQQTRKQLRVVRSRSIRERQGRPCCSGRVYTCFCRQWVTKEHENGKRDEGGPWEVASPGHLKTLKCEHKFCKSLSRLREENSGVSAWNIV